MAGVNKVILVGNLGADPEAQFAQQWRRSRQPQRRHLGELEGPRRQPPGKDRVAQCRRSSTRTSARVAKSYLRKGSKVYLEGQIQTRKWQDQSGNDRYTTDIVLQNFRGELVLLDSREGGGGGAAAAHSDEDFGGDDFGGGASARRSRARSRRRSTPTSTTTFRSRRSSLSSSASRAPRRGSPAPRVSTPASLSAASAPALRG